MYQSTCENCRTEFAIFFCSCFYPTPRLCSDCSSKHKPEPLHYLLPISQYAFVQSQDSYEALLFRLGKLDQARTVLTRDVNRIAVWRARLQNLGIEEGIRTQNSNYLETLHRLLQSTFDSSLGDVKDNIGNDDYQPPDDIKMTIWAYVIGTNPVFLSLLMNADEAESSLATASFHVEVNSLMPSLQQYRQTSKKAYGAPMQPAEIVLDSNAILSEEKRMSEAYLRSQADIDRQIREVRIVEMHLAELELKAQMEETKRRRDEIEVETRRIEANNQKEALKQQKETKKQQQKEAKRLKKEAERQKKENEKRWKKAEKFLGYEWKTSLVATFDTSGSWMLFFGVCLCWTFIGIEQCGAVSKLLDDDHKCIGEHVSFLLPTLFCCIGAALNRTYIRKDRGIKGSFILDLLLYSLHVFSFCLVKQERLEVGIKF